ncbi:hypothetical protein ACF3OC_11985 [Sphingobacterium cellulitidis]|nr:hypothetical protein CHT99_19785 [Sphingobacterium cellulitidis]
MKKKPFFIKADKILYNGLLLDSKLELKFVLMIEEYCAYMREPIAINYRKNSLTITEIYGDGCVRYKPDFLVRKFSNAKATLIEIKNSNSRNNKIVIEKQRAAENYKKVKNKDWAYIILDETEIKLKPEKQAIYDKIIEEYPEIKAKISYLKYIYKNDPIKRKNIEGRRYPYFNLQNLEDNDYKTFLFKGILPESKNN